MYEEMERELRNQEEINLSLKMIVEWFESIPNIRENYMEYISSLIYAVYENVPVFEKIIKDTTISAEAGLAMIDREISNIRNKEKAMSLFINIRFSEVIKEEYYYILLSVVEGLVQLVNGLKDRKKNLAEAYEYIILKAAENNEISLKNGEYYTPKIVIDTMIKLLDIKNNMAVYNPASGVGQFLVESVKHANIYAFGEETNISNYNICMTNLWVHDVYNKRIQEKRGEISELADVAIGNPPFVGDSFEDAKENVGLRDAYYQNEIFQKGSTYTKFLIMMLKSINESGKISVILPLGFLFRKTNSEYYMRRELTERNYIDAIIGLPEKLFYNTKIPVIILIINKKKNRDGILFIDASEEYVSKRKYNILTEENQEKILDTYKNYRIISKYSYVASLEEIRANDFDLSIKKYVQIQREAENINQEELEKKISDLEQERKDILKEIDSLIKDIKID